MSNLIKLFIPAITLTLILGAGIVLAQVDVTEEVDLDEDIQSEDLGIGEPRFLPDNPFYFLKNWGREIQSFFTFNLVKKAELKEKFASEKLIEVKKLIEGKRSREIIEKGIKNYQNEIEEMKKATERIRERVEENEEVGKFLDKFIQHQALHQRLLQKLENQVPPEVFEKIKEARERHLERFGEVMIKLEGRMEELGARLENNLEEIKGSKYKNFKNLEVLIELEEKVPEEAKEAIQKAQENALKRLKGDLEKMSPEDQERFKGYLEKVSGEKEKHLEILENLKSEIKAASETPKVLELKERLEEGKIKLLEKIEQKLEKLGCPLWVSPAAGFCKEGRVIIEKNPETGCPLPPKCIMPGEVEISEKPELEKPEIVCITLWDPVCGKDGKTYSNACFAKLAGAEVDYNGKCKEKECQTNADCPQLRCGPAGTISARCIGVKARCIEGKCQIISVPLPVKP